MIVLGIAIVLLTGASGLMIAALISNQVDPTYASALAIPIANLASLVLVLLALPFAGMAYSKHRDVVLARRTMVLTVALIAALAVLFPLSEFGYLSRVR